MQRETCQHRRTDARLAVDGSDKAEGMDVMPGKREPKGLLKKTREGKWRLKQARGGKKGRNER